MDKDILLVRYQTLAANRRHFSSLYFGVVAFSWSFGFAIWHCLQLNVPTTPAAAFCAVGLILLAGAFLANRLLQRERGSFFAMCNAWNAISGESPEPSQTSRPGAMAVVAIAQACVGIMLIVMSLVDLYGTLWL